MGIWISTRPQIQTAGILDSRTQEAHITLAYLDKKAYPKEDEEQTFTSLKEWLAGEVRPKRIAAQVHGIATWIVPQAVERYYLVALVSTGRAVLHRWRADLVDAIQSAGFHLNEDYPFLPHITLSHSFAPYTKIPQLDWPVRFSIDNLYISRGSRTHEQVW
jgi:2'-5' RNA ligase